MHRVRLRREHRGRDIAAPDRRATRTTGPRRSVLDTPDTPTIETLVDLAQRPTSSAAGPTGPPRDTLKNVVLKLATPDAANRRCWSSACPATVRSTSSGSRRQSTRPRSTMFEAADFAASPALVRGYIGPQRAGASRPVRYLVDPRVVDRHAWVTGANERRPARGLRGRAAATSSRTARSRRPRCATATRARAAAGALTIRRGIEIGHIFQLGRRFADAFGLDALGPDGKPIRITMGSYGMGVSRLVAAIAEQHHDERGLVWPRAVAPADVHVVAAGKGEQIAGALRIGAELCEPALRVIVDDRPGVSAGVKFTDAELIGVPTTVVVGRRLAEGFVEVRRRGSRDPRRRTRGELSDKL